jgi:hypothetical protein
MVLATASASCAPASPGLQLADEVLPEADRGMELRFSEGATPQGYEPGVPADFALITNLPGFDATVEQPQDFGDGVTLRVTSLAVFEHGDHLKDVWVGVKNFGAQKVCDYEVDVWFEDAAGELLMAEKAALPGRPYESADGRAHRCIEPGGESAAKLMDVAVDEYSPSDIAHVVLQASPDWFSTGEEPLDSTLLEGPRLRELHLEPWGHDSSTVLGVFENGGTDLERFEARIYIRDEAGYFRDVAYGSVEDFAAGQKERFDSRAFNAPSDTVGDALVFYDFR